MGPSPTGPVYGHRTTAPHDTYISCGVSACVYGSQSDRERVNAYQDGCGGAREGQSKDGVYGQGNQVRQVRPLAGNGDGT